METLFAMKQYGLFYGKKVSVIMLWARAVGQWPGASQCKVTGKGLLCEGVGLIRPRPLRSGLYRTYHELGPCDEGLDRSACARAGPMRSRSLRSGSCGRVMSAGDRSR